MQREYFIVWNKTKSEGVIVKHNKLAHAIQIADDTKCYHKNGSRCKTAESFVDEWGGDCTVEKYTAELSSEESSKIWDSISTTIPDLRKRHADLEHRIPTRPDAEKDGLYSPSDPRFLLHGGKWDYNDNFNIMIDDEYVSLCMLSGDGAFAYERYGFSLNRVTSIHSLMKWMHHLLMKGWFTNDMGYHLIEEICKHNGWSYRGGE